MERLKKAIKAALPWLYLPFYVAGFVIYFVARVLLSIGYGLMLEWRKSKDIIKNLLWR
jgi:hypothetical protein